MHTSQSANVGCLTDKLCLATQWNPELVTGVRNGQTRLPIAGGREDIQVWGVHLQILQNDRYRMLHLRAKGVVQSGECLD